MSRRMSSTGSFIKEIQRSIRKAFIKMGMIVGAAVLVVVLCAVFILPKVVSKFYYDPNEVAGKYEEMTTTQNGTGYVCLFRAVFAGKSPGSGQCSIEGLWGI